MTTKQKTKAAPLAESRKSVPLIIEEHPQNYSGLPFITLIQYRKQPILTVVDNVDDTCVRAFVLDLCGPEHVSEELFINVVNQWYTTSRHIPLSIFLSREGLTNLSSRIYRSLSTEFISRIIGPIQKYPFDTVVSIKRRRRKAISPMVEIDYTSIF